jgi:hypothetical protein
MRPRTPKESAHEVIAVGEISLSKPISWLMSCLKHVHRKYTSSTCTLAMKIEDYWI